MMDKLRTLYIMTFSQVGTYLQTHDDVYLKCVSTFLHVNYTLIEKIKLIFFLNSLLGERLWKLRTTQTTLGRAALVYILRNSVKSLSPMNEPQTKYKLIQETQFLHNANSSLTSPK